ncbi:MAG TPA: hypothetical protein P5531_09585 [Bacteroidales bacterium]|nr:hypothetical protein [Bacteroidales bacterium]HSA43887.1 hypothetical protein [Bacteroidales bacterium]
MLKISNINKMINLDFTEKELDTLKEYFQSELLKTEQKIDSIKGILEKIGKKTGKVYRSEKKAARKALKKMKAMAHLIEPEIKIRKKPGPKPKTEKVATAVSETPEKKRRGRPPRAKEEVKRRGRPRVIKPIVEAEATPEPAVKTRRKRVALTIEKPLPVVQETKVRKRGPRTVKAQAAAVTEQSPRRKPGRPPKAASEKKPVKPGPKVPKKKAIKIPWGAWITNVLRDSEENLSQQIILDTIAKRLQLAGPELESATVKILDQFSKLQKTGKIISQQSGDATVYGLKISGRKGR